jgi:hypothetical protein
LGFLLSLSSSLSLSAWSESSQPVFSEDQKAAVGEFPCPPSLPCFPSSCCRFFSIVGVAGGKP